MKPWLKKAAVACLILTFTATCEEDDNDAETAMAGPLATALANSFLTLSGFYIFQGEVDTDKTPSCGSVKAATTTTTSTTDSSSSSSSSGSSTDTATRHSVDAFYYLKLKNFALNVATVTLRYEYNENTESYSLTPTSSTQTCLTTDGVNCNGTDSSIHSSCDTVDNVKCGGTYTYIFTGQDPAVFTFQARSGTFNWANGFTLDDNKEKVSFARLSLNMISSDGSIMRGTINCLSQEQ
jgi:hypothetical protein